MSFSTQPNPAITLRSQVVPLRDSQGQLIHLTTEDLVTDFNTLCDRFNRTEDQVEKLRTLVEIETIFLVRIYFYSSHALRLCRLLIST